MSFMLSLDKRCQEILKRLIYAGGYLKIQDVADEMSISKRSVYYDINKINDWLQEHSLKPLVKEFMLRVSMLEKYRKYWLIMKMIVIRFTLQMNVLE